MSKDWTKEELMKASEVMKQLGFMSYEDVQKMIWEAAQLDELTEYAKKNGCEYLGWDSFNFSDRAREAIDYFDDTAFLFRKDETLIVTDESLELEDDDFGGPRWTGYQFEALNDWLEDVIDEIEAFGEPV